MIIITDQSDSSPDLLQTPELEMSSPQPNWFEEVSHSTPLKRKRKIIEKENPLEQCSQVESSCCKKKMYEKIFSL